MVWPLVSHSRSIQAAMPRGFERSSSTRTGRAGALVGRRLNCARPRREKCGFTSAELMATLSGERLYRSCGYLSQGFIQHILPSGIAIQFVSMCKHFGQQAGRSALAE